jgi:hypothetical protein
MLYNYLNFEVSISFNRLVLGYKIFDKEYFDVNYILTILGYSIYKCTNHMFRNKETKAIDVYKLFVKELRTRLNVCKIYTLLCCLTRYNMYWKIIMKNIWYMCCKILFIYVDFSLYNQWWFYMVTSQKLGLWR